MDCKQFGFMKGRGTVDVIQMIKQLKEKVLERKQQNVTCLMLYGSRECI